MNPDNQIPRSPDNLKIVFFGNTKYSVFGLEVINQKFSPSLIVTIPDKPSGRKRELKPSPVKEFALTRNLPLVETDQLDDISIGKVAKLKPDFLIVEDYGLILPESLLEIPRYAPLNIHHSLLPKYRGPSPAPAAILNGEKVSGVTIINMTEQVDAGDILAQKEYPLEPGATTGSLLTSLNKLGGELVLKVIEDFLNGRENPIKQDDRQASYTKRFTKKDGFIDLKNPPDPERLDRMIRAFYPWPNVWTQLRNKDERLMTIKFLPEGKIQPEGKRPMTIQEFLNGYQQTKDSIEKLFKPHQELALI